MIKKLLANSLMLMLLCGFVACGEGTDVVESGTYQGVIDKVNADESEIYVVTPDEKRLELYFTEQTTLNQGDAPVEFSALQQGQQVEVTVEKVGNRLDPISVVILE